MKFLVLIAAIASSSLTQATSHETDARECVDYVRTDENYKQAHNNEHCLRAANAGVGSAQYSVGMAYGFAGDSALEEKYYRLAANNRNTASYLALGHRLSENEPWEAIYWYQRYIATRADGWGYAALLVSGIFERLGEPEQAEYWLEVCRSSPYPGCKLK